MTKILQFDHLLSGKDWLTPGCLMIDESGIISATSEGTVSSAEKFSGTCVPGMPNLHSHAFQRAMVGLTEIGGGTENNFWTWQKVMYDFLARLSPDDLEAIATQLYVEMLKGGFTTVGEFHYLHHGPDGKTYDDPAEMSKRIFTAANRAGIALTHLPVLYAHGGFGGQPALDGQKRFLHSVDDFVTLVETLKKDCVTLPLAETGIAFHSLRAVSQEMMGETLASTTDGPVHIHISEQIREVEQCLDWSGQRPIEWLYDHMDVDRRWCLIHATHMTEAETTALAQSDTVAGLCPSTEANLGDGFFPLPSYLAQSGALGVGSDSNTSIDAADELRLLEYGQRLNTQTRNVGAVAENASTGASLFHAALRGGAQALAQPIGPLVPGNRADFIVLDTNHPALVGRGGDVLLDSWIFAAGRDAISDVFVGGRHVVSDRRHPAEEQIEIRYRETIVRLMG